jgi:AAA domain/Bifunctional DNA primase/polymerase, N-terminal
MTSPLAALRNSLRVNGYSPIPANGKRPVVPAWQNKTETNHDEIALWDKVFPEARNTSILTKRVPTFDIDIFNPEAAEAVEELARERFEERGYFLTRIGKAPKRAILLRTDAPFAKISRSLIGPDGSSQKLEVLADGQQVVLFGTHPDTGKPYYWHGGEPGEIKREDLPYITAAEAQTLVEDAERLLIDKFGYKPVALRENDESNGETSGRDWEWLASAIMEGRELHDSICAVAAKLVASGMHDGAAVNLIRGWLASSSAPRDGRWRERFNEVPRAVASAREKFGGKQADPPQDVPPKKLFMSSGDFVKGYVAPEYIVDGILRRAFSYSFTAKTGDGKTAIALYLAACVAMGKKFAGKETEKGRVIFFAGENSEDIRARWIAMSAVLGFDPDKIDVWFRDGVFKISEAKDRILAEVQEIGDITLIIVDTSAAFLEGDNENDTVQLQAHAARLRELCKLPGKPCVLTNCHPIKNATEETLIPRGAGAYLAEVDGNLTAFKEGSCTTVHHLGKIRGPDFAPITFELKTVTVDAVRDAKGRLMPTVIAQHVSDSAKEEMTAAKRADEDLLLEALKEDGSLSMAKLASKVGWYTAAHEPNKTKVFRALEGLRAAGLVRKYRGQYTLTDKATKETKAKKGAAKNGD